MEEVGLEKGSGGKGRGGGKGLGEGGKKVEKEMR